jgi:hypothetical protein
MMLGNLQEGAKKKGKGRGINKTSLRGRLSSRKNLANARHLSFCGDPEIRNSRPIYQR